MAARQEISPSKEFDIFDDVVFIEQKLHSDGYNEGFLKGQLIGELEGFRLGVGRGKAFGQEVGFYEGFSSMMTMLYENETKSKRLLKVLNQMNGIIEKIKQRNMDPQNQELFDDLEELRAKFKQVSAMLNATPEYGKLPKTTVDF